MAEVTLSYVQYSVRHYRTPSPSSPVCLSSMYSDPPVPGERITRPNIASEVDWQEREHKLELNEVRRGAKVVKKLKHQEGRVTSQRAPHVMLRKMGQLADHVHRMGDACSDQIQHRRDVRVADKYRKAFPNLAKEQVVGYCPCKLLDSRVSGLMVVTAQHLCFVGDASVRIHWFPFAAAKLHVGLSLSEVVSIVSIPAANVNDVLQALKVTACSNGKSWRQCVKKARLLRGVIEVYTRQKQLYRCAHALPTLSVALLFGTASRC
eukprot:NODE_1526_length_1502_cov_159.761872_g1377_i0.p1 GENE.NODE_1526_length_1502_cov_159.761872_g1377_i0~~NODE_1526_length_1502_cov_159.761872_g1377_i0.p1  ORF type:complete len:264 (+),score=31.94 NODE_1526_length_1502_cov_159.761872_g1377_i0:65-856(+)